MRRAAPRLAFICVGIPVFIGCAYGQEAAGTGARYLSESEYERLFDRWQSVREFVDDNLVYGGNSEEIGEVKDIIFGNDGAALSVIVEVGGFWDIGDTHVSIPWDEIIRDDPRDGIYGIIVPVTEDSIADFSIFDEETHVGPPAAASQVTEIGEENAVVAPAWRATALLGDFVRLERSGEAVDFGYVHDMFLEQDRIATIVVRPDVATEIQGLFAFPFPSRENGMIGRGMLLDLPYAYDEVVEHLQEVSEDQP